MYAGSGRVHRNTWKILTGKLQSQGYLQKLDVSGIEGLEPHLQQEA